MKIKFNVEGMSCSACSSSVEKAVKRLEGVKDAQVNLLSKNMTCEIDDKIIDSQKIINAVKKAGFSASEIKENTDKQDKKINNNEVKDGFTNVKTRLIVSIIFLIPLMYIAMGHMLSLPFTEIFHYEKNALAFAFTQLLLSIPIIYVNRKFFFVGFKALIHKSPNMDSLVAVGSSAAIIYGIFSIYMIGYGLGNNNSDIIQRYMSNLYFESATMILTLITVGKFFEERSKNKTNASITKLLNLSPKTAIVLRDGKELEINTSDIIIGDIIIIKPGERIPVDGVIIEGNSSIDQSALTGESVPVDKTTGDNVMSASINTNGFIKIKALKVGKDTTLARIIELVQDASNSKAPIARMADKVSGVFVPVVMAIAILSTIIWLLMGQSFEFALGIGISVLVISCPCALGLATPVAITVAMGRSASKGILVKSAESLEVLHLVDTVVLDKTGTITVGMPSVTDIISLINEDQFIKIAASVESQSEHPLSKAITQHFKDKPLYNISDFKAVFGKGISATIDGVKYYAGNKTYMDELNVDISNIQDKAYKFSMEGKTPLFFAKESSLIGVIAVADTIKDTSYDAINDLKQLKTKVIMLTGDNKITANAIKNKLNIDEVISDVLPEDKEKIILKLQNKGRKVVMVGDGINDSPSLSRADVGIAVGSGSDIAIDSADIVLMKNDLRDVSEAIKFSKKVITNIKENLFWAFFYNILGIPVAAGVLFLPFGIILNPMIASAAMSVSSIFVVTNALRLYKK